MHHSEYSGVLDISPGKTEHGSRDIRLTHLEMKRTETVHILW